MRSRPEASEHAPYYGKYVALVSDGDIVQTLAAERDATLELLRGIPEEKTLHRYAEGKWSIKENCVHVTDIERVLSYRAVRIARGDQTPLASVDQDSLVPASEADARDWGSIIEEYRLVREATIALFANLPEPAWARTGTASGNPVSVRALAYILAGHDIHHRKLLREKYL